MSVTSDLRFIHDGDVGTLVFNVPLNPEYHVTPNKTYAVKVVEEKHQSYIELEYTNDVGETSRTSYDRNTQRDGYETVVITVPDDVFSARVEELRESHVTSMRAKHDAELNSWNSYCDETIEKAKQ